jgi:hypothetical protein
VASDLSISSSLSGPVMPSSISSAVSPIGILWFLVQ